MKSKYKTYKLLEFVIKTCNSFEPLVKAGYVKESVIEALHKISCALQEMNALKKSRDNAIRESLALLFAIENNFFPENPVGYSSFIRSAYEEYNDTTSTEQILSLDDEENMGDYV